MIRGLYTAAREQTLLMRVVALSIGELAREVGETVKTLRYWTDHGLLGAERGENGYRYYREDAA